MLEAEVRVQPDDELQPVCNAGIAERQRNRMLIAEAPVRRLVTHREHLVRRRGKERHVPTGFNCRGEGALHLPRRVEADLGLRALREALVIECVCRRLIQGMRADDFGPDVGGIDRTGRGDIPVARRALLVADDFCLLLDEVAEGARIAAYNEADDAKAVARHLGTVHHEQYVTAEAARDIIPLLPSMYDEPFADSSQIPTHLVSRFAREQVTVALTGDGGDELFGGYYRHFIAPRVWGHLQRLPKPVRAMASSPLSRVPWQFWNSAAGILAGRRQAHIGVKIQKALGVAARAGSFDDVYRSLLDEWDYGPSPLAESSPADFPFDLDVTDGAPDTVRMMYCDAVSYLPDDILCKVDRASMAVALEARVPFLDHRVAEVAAHIPLSMKIREGRGKHILRKLLDRYVPRELVHRPKTGFAVPVGEWIKGPLRDWAEDLLNERTMRFEGWFDAEVVNARWQDHLSGRRDSTASLWAVLMFLAWLREEKAASAVAA